MAPCPRRTSRYDWHAPCFLAPAIRAAATMDKSTRRHRLGLVLRWLARNTSPLCPGAPSRRRRGVRSASPNSTSLLEILLEREPGTVTPRPSTFHRSTLPAPWCHEASVLGQGEDPSMPLHNLRRNRIPIPGRHWDRLLAIAGAVVLRERRRRVLAAGHWQQFFPLRPRLSRRTRLRSLPCSLSAAGTLHLRDGGPGCAWNGDSLDG